MSTRLRRRFCNAIEVITLSTREASVTVAPALGGRIVSLRDRLAGREWLDGWAPATTRRLWHPADPADFTTGPGAGADECLPTVLACRVQGRDLADHGEIWNQPARTIISPSSTGGGPSLDCSWVLQQSPLRFQRVLTLAGNRLTLDYRLENTSCQSTPFLWAWHPLFSWRRGDCLHFDPAVDSCLSPGGGAVLPWPGTAPGTDLSRARFAPGAIPAAKVFLGPLRRGHAEIHTRRGNRLSLDWPAGNFPYAGIWITRGFWKGLHHWAVEPTNAPVDCLSDIGSPGRVSLLEPAESRTWRVTVTLHSS